MIFKCRRCGKEREADIADECFGYGVLDALMGVEFWPSWPQTGGDLHIYCGQECAEADKENRDGKARQTAE